MCGFSACVASASHRGSSHEPTELEGRSQGRWFPGSVGCVTGDLRLTAF